MVLVDTSVWVRFLNGHLDRSDALQLLLQNGQVAGHPLVYGELLIGDVGGRLPLLSDYELMESLPSLDHESVVYFVKARGLHGRGIGWIDAHLLASSVVSNSQFWTIDRRLTDVAAELGIAF